MTQIKTKSTYKLFSNILKKKNTGERYFDIVLLFFAWIIKKINAFSVSNIKKMVELRFSTPICINCNLVISNYTVLSFSNA